MRRFFIAVLVLAIVVVLALWGVISYRNQMSYNSGMVDSRATRVIKVDVGSLTRDIGWNAFWNPSYYAEEGSSEFMEKKKIMRTGLGALAKVFLFQVGDEPFWSNPSFGILPISDIDSFSRFLQTELGMRVGRDSVGRFGRGNQLLVRYDDRQAAVALGNFGPGHERLADSLLMWNLGAYLAGEQLINIRESPFYEAMTQSGHVVSVGQERLSVEFLEGEIVLTCALNHAVPASASSRSVSWGDTSFVRLRGSLMGMLPAERQFSIGNFVLHSDSLRQLATGDLVGEWKGMATQTDSVVTWAYDDNFEMREEVELVERPAPDMYFSVQTKTDGLQQYLLRHAVLDSVSSEINPAFFPLFRVFWQQEGDWLTFHTLCPQPKAGQVHDGQPLFIEADIHAIKEHTAFPAIQSFLTPFRALTVAAEEESDRTVLRGRIAMEDNTVNSLMQLLVRKPGAS